MEKRLLGRSELEVSPLGIGCWAIGGPWLYGKSQAGWGDVDDDESTRAIHCALDKGINFFDTAANYGAGHSERILGGAIAGRRDQVVIATKFGYKVDEAAKQVSYYGDPGTGDIASHVRQDCEASLRRLNTDYIDLYQFHLHDYSTSKTVEVCDVLEELVGEGKVRFYGWSTDNVAAARSFAQGKHCVAVQHDLNVMKDAPEMLAICEQLDLASVNRAPFGHSFLTGKYPKDVTFPINDIRHYNWFRNRYVNLNSMLDGLEAIRDILTSNGRTLAQGALAWIWARSERTIPIPGIRTVAQAEENARAVVFGPLSGEQMKEIDVLLGRD